MLAFLARTLWYCTGDTTPPIAGLQISSTNPAHGDLSSFSTVSCQLVAPFLDNSLAPYLVGALLGGLVFLLVLMLQTSHEQDE